MRFTTRSNLLRHAYRRHGLTRDSEERRRVLITLTASQQMKHAEQEASRLVSSQLSMGRPSEEFTPLDDSPPPATGDVEIEVCRFVEFILFYMEW